MLPRRLPKSVVLRAPSFPSQWFECFWTDALDPLEPQTRLSFPKIPPPTPRFFSSAFQCGLCAPRYQGIEGKAQLLGAPWPEEQS